MGQRISRSSIFIGIILSLAIAAVVIIVLRDAMTRDKESGLGDAFTYDLESLRKTDPDLVKYEETGNIETGFQRVFAITVDRSDRVYVAGDKSVRIFSDKGDTLRKIELADSAGCLAVDDDGTLYVGLKDHIEVYNPSGARKARWESPGRKTTLTSIAISGDYIFAADAGGRAVLRYDSSGKLVSRIGEKDKDRNISGFVIPSPYFDLAVASDGLLRVVNPGLHRIEAYTFDGDLEFWWGKASTAIDGFSGCCNPVNFAFMPDGGFVTCEKGLPRVKIYDIEGVFQSVVAGADTLNTLGRGIIFDVAADSQGRILLLDPIKRVFRIFTLIQEAES